MPAGVIRFGRDVVCGIEASIQREWLESNGLGGFASSTIIGLNTRRYHGLLVAATRPPGGRLVLLSKIEETIAVGGKRFELSANRYPGTIHPQGHRYMTEFRLDPFPVFTYEVNGLRIEKRVFMVHGENTTVVEYEALDEADCVVELKPLIAFRDYHGLTHRNGALNASVDVSPGLAAITPYEGLPTLHMAHNGGEISPTGDWYLNFEYSEERNRGLDYQEDLFNPFVVSFAVSRGKQAHFIASTDRRDAAQANELREREIRRRDAAVAMPLCKEPVVQAFAAAASHFIVKRDELKTVIAGYHWFGDWGRDTMIALPGLALATGRFDIAKSILVAHAGSLDRGLLPNRFPEAGETPEYNTVDATLWFFEATRALLKYTGDFAFVRETLYEKLKDIVQWHVRGTRHGIRVDDDGLLAAGEPGAQLTWMDAKIGDWVVTPRHGKAVEIQALWHNALRTMEDLANRFGDWAQEAFSRELADHASASFNRAFWNAESGCLFDAVDGGQGDGSIRPNQIFAVSLAHTMLSEDRSRRVVEVVRRELLTPAGLRSLSPRDPRYRPRYEGGVRERDSAYHQGTVWPWLLGPFITAYAKVNHRSDEARAQAARWLDAFEEHMRTAGLGHVSEIADAEPPHEPRGCVAQAWSAAELLRAAVEDVFVAEEGTGAAARDPA